MILCFNFYGTNQQFHFYWLKNINSLGENENSRELSRDLIISH